MDPQVPIAGWLLTGGWPWARRSLGCGRTATSPLRVSGQDVRLNHHLE